MSKFLETYGVAIFTLVLVAILIAFAGPLGMKIKNATTEKVSTTEEIGCDEVYVATTGRPKPPKTAVDQVYCIYYNDGELTISQNEIDPEEGRTVVKKGFYSRPSDCTTKMITVRFEGAVKPKSCDYWFVSCRKLTDIQNMKNLYTNECTSMSYMFANCNSLANLDLSNFDTSKVTSMFYMFADCNSLANLDLSNFDTSKVINMSYMFAWCKSLINVDISGFNTSKVKSMGNMFSGCTSLIDLDVSGFNTSNVINMDNMFSGCNSLTSLDVSKFDTSNVKFIFSFIKF